METLTLVDGGRGRTLETHLYLPAGEATAPLVVFAHGLSGHPKRFTRLLTALAQAGYVAAAPLFPGTGEGATGGVVFEDVAEQPADVAVVIDALARDARVDAARIAVAGFSLGAMTVYGLVYDARYRDSRVRAAVAMSGRFPFFGEVYGLAGPPLLVVHGRHDEVVRYADGVEMFDLVEPPKALLALDVDGHHEPFEDYGEDAGPVIDAAVVAFLDLTLRGDAGASARLDAAGEWPRATLVRDGL